VIKIKGSPFNWMGKRQCRCTFDVRHPAGPMVMQLQCVLPTGHAGQHMSKYGRWWNRNEFMEGVSKAADNPNAQSATGRRTVFMGPDLRIKK
jgi:hypothetical protein